MRCDDNSAVSPFQNLRPQFLFNRENHQQSQSPSICIFGLNSLLPHGGKRRFCTPLLSFLTNLHRPFFLFHFFPPLQPLHFGICHLTSQQQSELTEQWETIEAGSLEERPREQGGARDRSEAQAKKKKKTNKKHHPSGVSRLVHCAVSQ